MRSRAACLAAVVACCAAPARADEALVWALQTASPAPSEGHLDALESAAITRCGRADARLDTVARAIVAQKRAGAPMPTADAIARLQRAAGEPHPWARAWAARAPSSTSEGLLERLDGWLASEPGAGERRCGAAQGLAPDGERVLVVVVVDALADLAPLPVRARTGQWLTVRARLLPSARGAKVVVVAGDGSPRALPTAFDAGTVQARFAVDRPGEITIQVLADLPGGPRPVLEASVFGDVEPPARAPDATAPGEEVDAAGDDDDRVSRMLLAARAEFGVAPLVRDSRLDAVAHVHSARMRAHGELAHDAGDGTPVDRLRDEGLEPARVGENVARAANAALAHRALWSSPSHRANMLRRDFTRFGVGVVRDDRGDLWVTEVFAGLPGEGRSLPGEGRSLPGEGRSLPGEGRSLPGEGRNK
jgi:hypothetical protein